MNLSAPRPKGRSLPSTRAQAEGLKVHPEPRFVTPPSKAGLRAVEWVNSFFSLPSLMDPEPLIRILPDHRFERAIHQFHVCFDILLDISRRGQRKGFLDHKAVPPESFSNHKDRHDRGSGPHGQNSKGRSGRCFLPKKICQDPLTSLCSLID